jgi:hypothetical protein
MVRAVPFIVVVMILTLTALSVSAQRSIGAESLTLIEAGLDSMGMVVDDLAMPSDFITRDAHRMPFHDRLFTHPLEAFDQSHFYARVHDVDSLMSRAMLELGLGHFVRQHYAMKYSAHDLTSFLSMDVTDHLEPAEATVVIRVLEGVATAFTSTEEDRGRWWAQRILVDLADSIWVSQGDDDEGSLYESYEQDRAQRKRARTFFERANPEGMQSVFIHGASLYQHLLEVITDVTRNARLEQSTVPTKIFTTPIGRIAIGGPGDDVYRGDFAVIIDVGGNDVYQLSSPDRRELKSQPIRCIIDLSGDDVYTGGHKSIASAHCGISVLIDVKGDDTYRSGDFSQGSATFGFAVLHDQEGNDTYIAGQNSQASASFGIGLLFDLDGHDLYQCHTQGQGFGATRGLGLLVDHRGNDQYAASSPIVDALRYDSHFLTFTQGAALGYRPLASGGIGILCDREGNDTYSTDIYGQGTAYWFGLGALIDLRGEDRYQAYQYAQGSGVHLATGLLHDLEGDDLYASHGVSQGCGHDVALGVLIDEGGHDTYSVESLSLGGGNANAVSLFVDRAGNDSYIARNTSNTLGYSDFRRYQGMIGLFIDGGGSDLYGESTRNSTMSVKSTYGAFIDVERFADAASASTQPSSVEMPLADNLDSLFIQASAAPLKYQNNVVPARDKLAAMDPSIADDLSIYFSTEMPRERLTLEYVLPKLRERDPTKVDPILERGLRSRDLTERTLCATVAGKVKAVGLVSTIIDLAADTAWKSRRLVALTLGQIEDPSSTPTLKMLARDPHPWVRARAGYALAFCAGDGALTACKDLLSDEHQIVRNTTAEGLRRGPALSVKAVKAEILRHSEPHAMMTAMLLIDGCDTTEQNRSEVAAFVSQATDQQRRLMQRIAPLLEPFWTKVLLTPRTAKRREK